MILMDSDSQKVKLAVMAENIEQIKSDISEIKEQLKSCYVTKIEFDPIKKIVYGMVGSVLLTVLGAVLVYAIR